MRIRRAPAGIYTTGIEWCQEVTVQQEEPKEGHEFLRRCFPAATRRCKGPAGGHLDAYDPVTGKKFWSYPSKYPLLASAACDGRRSGLHRRSGRKFLRAGRQDRRKSSGAFQTGSGHRGSPITYSVNGRQYIATPSGWGSALAGLLPQLWPETEDFPPGSTLFVFALPGGNAVIAGRAAAGAERGAARPSIARGEQNFRAELLGRLLPRRGGRGGARSPAARPSVSARDYLDRVVRDGIPNSAMPGWKDRLKDDDIRAVVEYVVEPGFGHRSGAARQSHAARRRARQRCRASTARRRPSAVTQLFFDPTRENCGVCHAMGGRGIAIGPDLAKIAEKNPRDVTAAVQAVKSQHVLTATLAERRNLSGAASRAKWQPDPAVRFDGDPAGAAHVRARTKSRRCARTRLGAPRRRQGL